MSDILVRGDQYYTSVAVPAASNSWTAASVAAQSNAGHLVTLTDAAEDRAVRTFAAPQLGDYWIGLTDSVTEGVFVWVTGEPVVFTRWLAGEPNGVDGDEDFVTGNSDGAWNDNENLITVDQIGGYVIEWDGVAQFGSAGNSFRTSADTFRGSNGADQILAYAGNDTIKSGNGADEAFGGTGNDLIQGGNGDDALRGNQDNDTIVGGGGSDTLSGGNGADRLTGARGADHFVFETGGGADVITDFALGTDRLLLDSSLWNVPLSLAQVVAEFGSVTDRGFLLDFGSETLHLLGILDGESLVDDILLA